MRFRIAQSTLKDGLSVVGRAVSSRSVLPILGNILLATDGERLKLTTTDLEIGITRWIEAQIEEAGAITVPAKTLIDLVSAFPQEHIDCTLRDMTQTLTLRTSRNTANVKGIAADEFPAVDVQCISTANDLDAETFKQAISQVVIAAATEQSRPILTGIQLVLKDGMMTLAAADGFRLSVKTVRGLPDTATGTAIIPARALIEWARICDGDFAILFSENRVGFSTPNTLLVSQLIEGNYPDFSPIIPKESKVTVTVARDKFLVACKTAAIFARESSNIMCLTLKPDTLVVSGTSAESGDSINELAAEVTGIEGELAVAFNVKYLVDMLSVVDAAKAWIALNDPVSPGVFKGQGDDSFTYIIMPMHLGK